MNIKFANAAPPNAAMLVEKAYVWTEIADETFDVAISGQVFEHVEYFWVTLLELRRILKPGGILVMTAPSHWPEHRAPYDCYRFYGDGLYAMAKYIGFEVVYAYAEHEPFVGRRECDAILVAKKPLVENKRNDLYKKAHAALLELLPDDFTIEASRNKPTFQSSHSKKWETPEYCSVAGNAVSGIVTGNYSFHTEFDINPWWLVDLLAIMPITKIEVFNRRSGEERAYDIDILVSNDFLSWEVIHSNKAPFGGAYDGNILIYKANNIKARYVRIQKRSEGYLHLDQLKVFSSL